MTSGRERGRDGMADKPATRLHVGLDTRNKKVTIPNTGFLIEFLY
jgi:hypothetical protein